MKEMPPSKILQGRCVRPDASFHGAACTKPRANPQPISCQVIPQKDTVIPYIAQPRYPLNSQVLAVFFPSASITTTPHHPALLIDILSPQHGRLSFSLYFMTNTLAFDLPLTTFTSFLKHPAGPIPLTPAPLT